MNGSAFEIATAIISSSFGALSIACFIVGQMDRPLGLPMRALLAVAGVLLLLQGLFTDMAGFALLLAALLIERSSGARAVPI